MNNTTELAFDKTEMREFAEMLRALNQAGVVYSVSRNSSNGVLLYVITIVGAR